jgi:hypothetical protein
MDQPDAFAVRFQNDLGGRTVLALCDNNQCENPYYLRQIATGGTDKENITPTLRPSGPSRLLTGSFSDASSCTGSTPLTTRRRCGSRPHRDGRRPAAG